MNLAAIRAAMQTSLENIPGLKINPYVPITVAPPCVDISLQQSNLITFHKSEGMGDDSILFDVTLLVIKADRVEAQKELDKFFMQGGINSIKVALEATDFNGVAQAIICKSVSRYGPISFNEGDYLGAVFNTEVITSAKHGITRIPGSLAKLLLDDGTGHQVDVTADLQEITGIVPDRAMVNVTTFGKVGYTKYSELQKGVVTLKSWYNPAPGGLGDVVKDFYRDTAPRAFTFYPAGTKSGYPMYTGLLWINSAPVNPKSNDVAQEQIVKGELWNGITRGVAP